LVKKSAIAAISWIKIIIAAITLRIKLQKGNNCTSTQLRETEHGTY